MYSKNRFIFCPSPIGIHLKKNIGCIASFLQGYLSIIVYFF
jgi:hypothetical protein